MNKSHADALAAGCELQTATADLLSAIVQADLREFLGKPTFGPESRAFSKARAATVVFGSLAAALPPDELAEVLSLVRDNET